MAAMEISQFAMKPLLTFLEAQIPHVTENQKETIKKCGNLVVCYVPQDVQNLKHRTLSWQDIKDIVEANKLKNGLHINEDDKIMQLLRKDEWHRLYKIIGSSLILFLFQKAVLCEVDLQNVLQPLDQNRMLSLFRKTRYIKREQSKTKDNFSNVLASKCVLHEEEHDKTSESDKPQKKTRRGKKKKRTIDTVNRTGHKRGYRETLTFNTQRMLFSRTTNEKWPSSHVLATTPATAEGTNKLLTAILSTDVGKKVPVETHKLADLKLLLLQFLKNHRKHSSYSYLLNHHINVSFDNTKPVKKSFKKQSQSHRSDDTIILSSSSDEIEVVDLTEDSPPFQTGMKRKIMNFEGNQDRKRCKFDKKCDNSKLHCVQGEHSTAINIESENSTGQAEYPTVIDIESENSTRPVCIESKDSETVNNQSLHETSYNMPENVSVQAGCSKDMRVQLHCKKSAKNQPETSNLLKTDRQKKSKNNSVDHVVVAHFVKKIVRMVFPLELFGCKRNARVIAKWCCRLVGSGRNQFFRLGSLMQGIKTNTIKWLRPVSSHEVKENILAKVLLWIINEFVMVLVRTYFYVTDISRERKKIVFYHKRVYHRSHEKALSDMVRDGKIKKISETSAEILMKSRNFPGVGVLRFLPKKDSARPIIMFKYRPEFEQLFTYARTYLLQMERLHHHTIRPTVTKELHTTWCNFWEKWNRNGRKPLFFIRTDISDAYGSILIKKLNAILKEVIPKDGNLTLKEFLCVTILEGNLNITHRTGFANVPVVIPDNSAFIDNRHHQKIPGNRLLTFLSNLLKLQMVKSGKRTYILKTGIPQGGRLSCVLCNLYYSHMDKTHLSEFISDENLLLRAVDDYLFITPDLTTANRFFERMKAGFPDYGCKINIKKTQSNLPNQESMRTNVEFCGNVLDSTLQIQGDYTRYENQNIAHSLTLRVNKSPGSFLHYRLGLLSSLKLHAFYLDELYNSRRTVLTNVFHAALLQAYRFHSIIKNVFDQRNLNQKFLAGEVSFSAEKIAKRVIRVSRYSCTGGTTLDFNSVLYIVYRAYKLRLSRRGSQYPGVLRAIKWVLKSLSYRIKKEVLQELEETTSKLPVMFKTVK
ncbi:telomerase reverse transcriptase-like [Periplaneta americana]|uniref:telomerase reverse transcriptase-like n=1 Tax=Periplaneta americana TaxID=6978 RepID=UPI0037E89644